MNVDIEKLVLSSLLLNEEYFRKTFLHIKDDYFEEPQNKTLFNLINDYTKKYNIKPEPSAIKIMLDDHDGINENVYSGAVETLSILKKESQNIDFLIDTTQKWVGDRAVYLAIMKSVEIISDENGNRSQIVELVKDAISIDFTSDLGHNYFEDTKKQLEYYKNEAEKIPFGLETLNNVTKGYERKTLNLVVMPSNLGKTTWLIQMAREAMMQGLNVVYFSLEIAEEVVRLRTDVGQFGIGFEKIKKLSDTEYLAKVNDLRNMTNGELYIKEYPPSRATANHFRYYLEELKLKNGFVPDLIIVDYLTIVASSRMPSNAIGNTNTYFTSVAEELRALGVEYNAAVWSAVQSDKDSQVGKSINVTNIGLAKGMNDTSDFTIAMYQDENMIVSGRIALSYLKSRYHDKNQISYSTLGLDNSLQKFYDVDPSLASTALHKSEQPTEGLVKTYICPKTGEIKNVGSNQSFKQAVDWGE